MAITLEQSVFPCFELERGGMHFGFFREVDAEFVARCEALVSEPVEQAAGVLGGRSGVAVGELPDVGRVVVKHYTRGGVIRHLIKRSYLRWGATRGELEFRKLQFVRSIGVRAPEPVAWAWRGGVLYRAWLLTREIQNHQTLADVALEDEDRAMDLLTQLEDQIRILIANRVFHSDLHPGNVLVDGDGVVHLLDFDKAFTYRGSPSSLRDQYILRWRRAVLKHQLPELLNEAMCVRLRTEMADFPVPPS